jgi:hypothetical protein
MQFYEYKTIPAPRKGEKARGIKGTDARFAHAFQTALNAQAAEGWEYQRSETLPVEHRTGLASKAVTQQSVLIFRRALETEIAQPPVAATPSSVAPTPPADQPEQSVPRTAPPAPSLQISNLRATRD